MEIEQINEIMDNPLKDENLCLIREALENFQIEEVCTKCGFEFSDERRIDNSEHICLNGETV